MLVLSLSKIRWLVGVTKEIDDSTERGVTAQRYYGILWDLTQIGARIYDCFPTGILLWLFGMGDY